MARDATGFCLALEGQGHRAWGLQPQGEEPTPGVRPERAQESFRRPFRTAGIALPPDYLGLQAQGSMPLLLRSNAGQATTGPAEARNLREVRGTHAATGADTWAMEGRHMGLPLRVSSRIPRRGEPVCSPIPRGNQPCRVRTAHHWRSRLALPATGFAPDSAPAASPGSPHPTGPRSTRTRRTRPRQALCAVGPATWAERCRGW